MARGFSVKDTEICRRVVLFFVRMLEESCPTDPFGLSSTPYHSKAAVEGLYNNIHWQAANPAFAFFFLERSDG